MRFKSEIKNKIQGISIHLELIMYGDVFLNIMKSEDGTSISWFSLCDGGDIAEKGTKDYPRECFSHIVDVLYNNEFQTQDDNEMQVCWEILCVDQDGNQIATTEFGNWNGNILRNIIRDIQEIIIDDEPLQGLIETLNA